MLGVALVVYAYHHGGASAVGLLALIRWLPAALVSPFTAILGDRYPRVPVMLASDLLRSVGLAVMAVCVLTGAPGGIVYLLGGAGGGVNNPLPPPQAGLLPPPGQTPPGLSAPQFRSRH